MPSIPTDDLLFGEILTAIVKRFVQLVGGPAAANVARRIPRLVVDAEGNVQDYDRSDPLGSTKLLIDQYCQVFGDVALTLSEQTIQPIAKQQTDIVLRESESASSQIAPTSILIVDDHALFREGIASLLAGQPDFRVCGQASSMQEALALARRLKPDLVLMDIGLPGNGVSGGDDVTTHANNWAQTPTIVSADTLDNLKTVHVRGFANPLSLVDIYFDTQISVTRQLPVLADASGAFTFTGSLPGNNVVIYAASTLDDPAHPNRVGSSSQRGGPRAVLAGIASTTMQVAPAMLNFTSMSGPVPSPQDFWVTVPNNDPALAWHTVVTTTDGGSWLSVPLTGTGNGPVAAKVALTGLSPATYQGAITVVNDITPTDQASLTVMLQVQAAMRPYSVFLPIAVRSSP